MSGSFSLRCLATSLALFTAGAAEPLGDRLERNKAVARVVFEQILGRQWRVDLIDSVHTPDFVAHGARRDSDLEDDRRAVLGWRSFAPDGVMSVDGILAEGELVAVRWSGRGTNTGSGNGLPATGRTFNVRGMTFFRIEDGRIREEWTVFDDLGLLRQLGLLPAPQAGPGR